MVGDEMCEFVLQSAIHLAFKFVQTRIQLDGPAWIARIARRAAQPSIPRHGDELGTAGKIQRMQ
jgi:hypothetical protein